MWHNWRGSLSETPGAFRQFAQSRLQRERWDYPDRPAGIIRGRKFLKTPEAIQNNVVAVRVGVGDFVLGRPGRVLSRSA